MIYAFDDFELDIAKAELRREGAPVAVEPQVFSLLRVLVENADRLIARDEIIEIVWKGRFVSDAAVKSRISAARTALGDDGRTQRYIKTVHGQGLRFLGDVSGYNETSKQTTATVSAEDVLPSSLKSRSPELFLASESVEEFKAKPEERPKEPWFLRINRLWIVAISLSALTVLLGVVLWTPVIFPRENPASVERIAFPLPEKPSITTVTGSHVAGVERSGVPVVGWMLPVAPSASKSVLAAFQKGLAEAGFVNGKNVIIDLDQSSDEVGKLPSIAANLVRKEVAVILAGSPQAALAAKHATKTIPIVFTSGADPVTIGLVDNFNRPGGNVTGLHFQFNQIVGKRLLLFHEMVPMAKRIAILVNPANPSDAKPTVQRANEVARTLGVESNVFYAETVNEIDSAFEALVAWRADALFLGPDPFLGSRKNEILALAALHGIPTSGHTRSLAEAGWLMSYGPNFVDIFRRAGYHTGRILKGENPANMPIQQPTEFELLVNLKTAKSLGLTLSPSMLERADGVFE